MAERRHTTSGLRTPLLATVVVLGAVGGLSAQSPSDVRKCEALLDVRDLTITSARLVEGQSNGVRHCYVKGILPPAIGFHAQLPLPENWNGRFLQWGDGGKDGDLDFADHRVGEGYAVTNSNTGHDRGAEPGASFGWKNRHAGAGPSALACGITIAPVVGRRSCFERQDPVVKSTVGSFGRLCLSRSRGQTCHKRMDSTAEHS